MAIIRQVRAGRQGDESAEPQPPITAVDLAATIGADATRAGHLLATAWLLVRRYAPDAPDEAHREAIIRCAGYLREANFGARQSLTVGPMEAGYAANHAAMFRNSGAAALLSRWRVRRAGAIG